MDSEIKRLKEYNMNQIKSAIKTQKPKRKQQLRGVSNPITICTRIVQDQLNKVHRLDLPNSTPKQFKMSKTARQLWK